MRENRFYVDYDLTLNRRLFNARHLAWTDGTWLYVVRVVGPSNAIQQTIYLAEQMASELEPIPLFQEGDAGWTGHFDPVIGYVVRFPTSWEIQDRAPGRPFSIAIDDRASLRLDTLPFVIGSEEDAINSMTDAMPNAQLLSSTSWEDGYLISFGHETALGEEHSGLWLLLPNQDETTIRAEIDIAAKDLDLISFNLEPTTDIDGEVDPQDAVYPEILEVLRTLKPVSWSYITQDDLSSDEDGQIVLPISD